MGGLVNPAVGPATVVLVIVSINIQRRELAATIEEMRQANDSTARMIFEQTLFSWLENYHSPVRAIANSNGAQGRMPMVRWYNAELAPEVSVMRGTPLPTIHIASRFDGN